MMRVLVFGKTGQVAQALADRAGPDLQVTTLDRSEADLMNAAACADVIMATDAHVVINAAAFTAVDKAETAEAEAMQINGATPAAMAQAAAARSLPFLHVSTDYVFDGSGQAAWAPDAPTEPLGVYGASKLAGENGVRAAGGTHAILRTSWVFSAQGQNFVKTMLRLGRERDALGIVADQIGGPTAAADIADALLRMARALREDAAVSGTYHLSGAPDVSWADFAREIFHQAGVPCQVDDIATADYPTPARRPANSRLDCTSLRDVFDIKRPDWRVSLAPVIAALEGS